MSSKESIPARYPASGIDILIVGAGFGGLWSALECWRKGHNVRIIEAHNTINHHGDWVGVGPTGLSTLHHWPWLSERVRSIGLFSEMTMLKHTGEVIAGPFPDSVTNHKVRALMNGVSVPFLQIRPRFAAAMVEQLAKIGISVEFDKKVVEYYESDERGGVILKDGSKIEADLVVAADGVHTASWKLIKGENRTIDSGYSIFRTGYDSKVLAEHPELQKLLKEYGVTVPSFQFWYGPEMHGHLILGEDFIGWGLTHRDNGSAVESYTEPVPVERLFEVMDKVPGWAPIWRELGKTIPDKKLVDFKLYFRSPNPTWTSPQGRVIQLGDSAHAFIPSSGNGAIQAMEDAISLSTCLQIGGKSNIPWAVRVHTKLRFERVTCIQKMGFINRDKMHRTDWDAVAKNPESARPRMGDWNTTHRVEDYALDNYGRALSHLQAGTPFQNTNTPPGHVFKLWTAEEILQESNNGGIKVEPSWFDETDGRVNPMPVAV